MIKKWITAGMLAIAMFVPSIAFATESLVFDNAGSVVTITQEVCTDKTVLSYITPQAAEDSSWFAGTIFWQGQDISLCYTVVQFQGASYVLVVDAEGDNGMIPIEEFKVPGAFDKENAI